MTTDEEAPAFCAVEFVPGSHVDREPAFVPGLPIVQNGPPGTFVTFADGRRVPLPTDQITSVDHLADLAALHQLSPERGRRMTLDPKMVAAVFMEGRLAWGRPVGGK
jgi:hypothetical protein